MWINTIKKIVEQNGKNYIWLNQDCMFNSKLIYISECDSFKQLWHSIIVNDDNCCIYKLYKHVHRCEMYTHVLPQYLKIALFQFRIGTYKLPANNKFNNISIDEQICAAPSGEKPHVESSICLIWHTLTYWVRYVIRALLMKRCIDECSIVYTL